MGCSVVDLVGTFDATGPAGTRFVPRAFLTPGAPTGEATVEAAPLQGVMVDPTQLDKAV